MDFFDKIELERLLNNLYSGAVNPSRLPTDLYNKTLKVLLDAVYKGFGGTLSDFPEDTSNNLLLKHFERNIAIFSGAKTFQQVKDMSQAVFTPEGFKRDYSEFKRIVTGDEFHEGIFNKYNKNYLKTEYNTAISTAQMGSEWNQYVEDADVFPYLKYVTAHDERVRHSHQLFDGVIQPVGSDFWNTHVPPNGFNCRCRLVQLNPEDDVFSVTPDDQIKNLPKTDSPLFGMNPAKSGYIFDPSIHPYTKNIEERFKVASEQNFGFPTPPIPPAIKQAEIVTPAYNENVPKNIKKFFGEEIAIDPEFYSLLKVPTTLRKGKNSYCMGDRKVIINPNDFKTEYNRKKIIYHEFGHAIHEQQGWVVEPRYVFESGKIHPKVKDIVSKYEMKYGIPNVENLRFRKGFQKYDEFRASIFEKYKHLDPEDLSTQWGAMMDTICALSHGQLGFGHTRKYFTQAGGFMRYAEFMAHAFENKFLGNEIFKNEFPDLYEDTIKLINELMTGL